MVCRIISNHAPGSSSKLIISGFVLSFAHIIIQICTMLTRDWYHGEVSETTQHVVTSSTTSGTGIVVGGVIGGIGSLASFVTTTTKTTYGLYDVCYDDGCYSLKFEPISVFGGQCSRDDASRLNNKLQLIKNLIYAVLAFSGFSWFALLFVLMSRHYARSRGENDSAASATLLMNNGNSPSNFNSPFGYYGPSQGGGPVAAASGGAVVQSGPSAMGCGGFGGSAQFWFVFVVGLCNLIAFSMQCAVTGHYVNAVKQLWFCDEGLCPMLLSYAGTRTASTTVDCADGFGASAIVYFVSVVCPFIIFLTCVGRVIALVRNNRSMLLGEKYTQTKDFGVGTTSDTFLILPSAANNFLSQQAMRTLRGEEVSKSIVFPVEGSPYFFKQDDPDATLNNKGMTNIIGGAEMVRINSRGVEGGPVANNNSSLMLRGGIHFNDLVRGTSYKPKNSTTLATANSNETDELNREDKNIVSTSSVTRLRSASLASVKNAHLRHHTANLSLIGGGEGGGVGPASGVLGSSSTTTTRGAAMLSSSTATIPKSVNFRAPPKAEALARNVSPDRNRNTSQQQATATTRTTATTIARAHPSPPPSPRSAGGGGGGGGSALLQQKTLMAMTSSASPPPTYTALHQNESINDWEFDPASGMHWSSSHYLFLNAANGRFYDPRSDSWYDVDKEVWYTLESEAPVM